LIVFTEEKNIQQDEGGMKKVIFPVMGVVFVCSMVFGDTVNQVVSRNAVGYVKVEVASNGLALCTLNFNASDNTIASIFTNQLMGGINFGFSDQVIKWDPIARQYVKFWKNKNNLWLQYPETTVTTNILKPGDAFWIKNNHTSNQTVYLMGEVPDRISSPTQEVNLVSNLNFVAYCYPIEIAITNLNLTQAKAGFNFGFADNLIKWDAISKQYVTFWRHSSGWRQYPQTSSTTNVIRPGEGMWYKRLSNAFVWIESKPYSWP
jgi:hypothetical protein